VDIGEEAAMVPQENWEQICRRWGTVA